MSGKLQPGSRASRALAVLAEHPDGLLTTQIAELLGEYPWGLNEICRVLRIRERNGQVTATRRAHGASVHWKLARFSERLAG
jgi:hypothetical protein